MGAYGSALIAYDQWVDLTAPKPGEPAGTPPKELRSGIATLEQLENFHVDLESRRCGKCQNNCLLTINTFSDGDNKRVFITGNRCERGAEISELEGSVIDASNKKNTGVEDVGQKMPNLFEWKYKRLFGYAPLKPEDAPMGDFVF